jgi:hypothetical protein
MKRRRNVQRYGRYMQFSKAVRDTGGTQGSHIILWFPFLAFKILKGNGSLGTEYWRLTRFLHWYGCLSM